MMDPSSLPYRIFRPISCIEHFGFHPKTWGGLQRNKVQDVNADHGNSMTMVLGPLNIGRPLVRSHDEVSQAGVCEVKIIYARGKDLVLSKL